MTDEPLSLPLAYGGMGPDALTTARLQQAFRAEINAIWGFSTVSTNRCTASLPGGGSEETERSHLDDSG